MQIADGRLQFCNGQGASVVISYYTHGGLNDQLRQLVLARAVAEKLGRVLVLPPLLRHFEATPRTSMGVGADYHARGADQPRLASIIDVARLGVPVVEAIDLPPVHAMPSCNDSAAADLLDDDDARPAKCVRKVAAPEPGRGSALLRELGTLPASTWIHFDRSLFIGPRHRRRGWGFYMSSWEKKLRPTSCLVRYDTGMLQAASVMLRDKLRGNFSAIHVRALNEGGYKRERPHQWQARLLSLADSPPADGEASSPPDIYLATDDLDSVLPNASALMRAHGVRLFTSADFGLELPRLHGDGITAALAMDISACLVAARFAPAPRAGLSVHISALRDCERSAALCNPAASRVRWTSTACGGSFIESSTQEAISSTTTCPKGWSSLDEELPGRRGRRGGLSGQP